MPRDPQIGALFVTIGLLLEVVEKHRQRARLLPKFGDDGAARPDGLLDHGHLALGAQSADELLVLLVLAVLREAAETGGAAIEGLGALVKPLAESVVHESLLQDLRLVASNKRTNERRREV